MSLRFGPPAAAGNIYSERRSVVAWSILVCVFKLNKARMATFGRLAIPLGELLFLYLIPSMSRLLQRVCGITAGRVTSTPLNLNLH